MNISFSKKSLKYRNLKKSGFALIATIIVMSLLMLVALAMLSVSSVETRSSGVNRHLIAAQANARMALLVAIGELQESVGPDQRVTAQANILSSDEASEGRAHWVGVWDTRNYDPTNPDEKTFVRWLVSSNDGDASKAIEYVSSAAGSDEHVIFEGSDEGSSVKVPKVEITSTSDVVGKGYYAYWVEDEGVKADLGWNEGGFDGDERKQSARLSATSGPDYEVFEGPFKDKVTYPIESETSNDWLENMLKANSYADMGLVMSDDATQMAWLKQHRHDVTLHSRGVLSDVKSGGLRRDLSLAFEMDGQVDVSAVEQPTLFNQQVNEFVGSGDTNDDPLSSPQKPNGLAVYERFLWRDFNGGTKPYSSDISNDDNYWGENVVMRGPNWWAMRDFANLYKRLSGTAGDYTMNARAYYPNRSSENIAYSDYFSHFRESQTWDAEVGNNDSGNSFKSTINTNALGTYYLYRPAAANYAPVNLGTSFLVGLKAMNESGVGADATAELAVTLDPLFYFWNPYNRKIRCENIAVVFGNGVPGRVVFDVEENGATSSKDVSLFSLLNANISNRIEGKILFLIKGPFTLEPGEVVIASPKAITAGGTGSGEAVLGYATNNDSGIIMTEIEGSNDSKTPLRLSLDAEISFAYLRSDTNDGSSGNEVRHDMDTNLPLGNVSAEELVADMTKLGEQTQHNLQVLWSGSSGPSAYVNDAGDSKSSGKVRTESMNNMLGKKVIFGAHALLIKPASAGAPNANPFEMFARFNPAPMLMKRDTYVQSYPNQIYRHVTANTEFNVRDEMGIDFSGSERGTFWGLSYQNTGSTSVPMSNIPSSPLLSLADFAHANLSINGTDPFHATGNSWSNTMVEPISPFGEMTAKGTQGNPTAQDFSWLINDSLFDRYFLSGIAPEFTIESTGYNATGSLSESLTAFYGVDSSLAKASPVLEAYLPPGKMASEIITELTPNATNSDGYKRLGAYSMIKGSFNVNSTSVSAWTAFLRANRGLDVEYAGGGATNTDNSNTPFPSSAAPVDPAAGAQPEWSGFSRLTDAQIDGLAERIVEQVKLRGPFMSISDFVNHSVGPINDETSYVGAIQAAIEKEAAADGSGINASSRAASANSAATDELAAEGSVSYPTNYIPHAGPSNGRRSTTGIPGDITQADILRPLAPRLSARSDTFRIRAYGEVQDSSGNVIASATCEAVVQRLPEYLDSSTNDPWDDNDDLTSPRPLGVINERFGRRLKINSFRWLNPKEIEL